MALVRALFILTAAALIAARAGAADAETCGDGQLIFELPARVEAARKASQEDWDSGVTLNMVQATSKYIDALKGMMLDLNRTYYADPAGQEAIDDYVVALSTVREFNRAAANPRAEAQGSIVPVEAGQAIADTLEQTIEKMVEALIGEDKHYSIDDWRAQWKKALATTGEGEQSESP